MVTKTRIRLQCPECAHKFYSVTMFPDCCPGCGYVYEEPDNEIALPSIGSLKSAVIDKTYRDLEVTSAHRAEQAAAMAGVPVSEMSHLKVTDLRDNVQVGETYAKTPVSNPVTQQMELMQKRGIPIGFGGPIQGIGGPGASALGALQGAELNRITGRK
jgi:hypothetical protein